ncbi:S8 family serine peptidase [Corynebacterium sp. LK2510]|uniref:S8 family serine peptidase n=1 Tax=Corynebacterium sp. LK2510 TaxID=3110472 RepID=UPI0034CD8149
MRQRLGPGALACALVLPSLSFSPPASAQDIPCVATADALAPPAPDWAPELHDFATGAGIRVAVIDTGVSPHPELDQLVAGADFVTPLAPDPLMDCDGHGTVVAGIIAATGVGIAPDAEILTIRQTSAHYRGPREGEEGSGSVQTLADAIHSALDHGVDVINISVVTCIDPRDIGAFDTGVLDEALARAEHEGTVVVSAAGNVGPACDQGSHVLPAHSPTVLAVGARDSEHTIAPYSVDTPGDAPALSAPGAQPVGLSWTGPGFAYGTQPERDVVAPFAGTSFAAPVVSGTVALVKQRRPQLHPAQIRELVVAAAQPAGGMVDPLAVVTHVPVHTADHADVTDHGTPLVIRPARETVSNAGQRAATVSVSLAVAAVLAAAVWAASRPGGPRRGRALIRRG